MSKIKTKKISKIARVNLPTMIECIPTFVLIAMVTIFFLLVFSSGCVSPDAVKTEIQGIKNDFGRLEKIVEQKADNNVVAEQIEEINNCIEQTTQVAEDLSIWRKDVEAGVINYGGAGWVVVGTGVMAIIFVGAGLLLIRAFMRRGTLLTLVTCAIQKIGKSSPETAKALKKQLKKEVAGGKFREEDRQKLGSFARKMGTFLEQNDHSEV